METVSRNTKNVERPDTMAIPTDVLIDIATRRIHDTEVIPYMGVETFRYRCSAVIGGRERAFELRYSVRDHRWVLWRFMEHTS